MRPDVLERKQTLASHVGRGIGEAKLNHTDVAETLMVLAIQAIYDGDGDIYNAMHTFLRCSKAVAESRRAFLKGGDG